MKTETSTPNPTTTPQLSKEARADLLRQRFGAKYGWRKWKVREPSKEPIEPKPEPRKVDAVHDWSWCVMESRRLPPWLMRREQEYSIREEILRIRERGVISPLTMIMGIWEDARVQCKDLTEVSRELKSRRREIRTNPV